MTRDAVLLAAAQERLHKKRAKVPLAKYAPKPMMTKRPGFGRQQSY
jgi:hypothetical protein